ncbi:hypothetical protein KM043_009663 [Ampulex compressa]|nr:hypothetical protein KM043_009663 [Ampulex compressa]
MDLSKILKVLNGAESKFLSSENPNTKARRRGRERCPAEENFSTLMRRVDIKDGWLIQEHEVSSALKEGLPDSGSCDTWDKDEAEQTKNMLTR